MATLKQKTSFGPGIYRGHKFDIDRLRAFVEGTNRAIAAGVPIPLLKRHAPINASDSDTEQFATAKGEGAGWIKKLSLDSLGNIEWEADNVPDDVLKAKESGTLKFTSPEFRNHYVCEKAGVYEGPVIRHFAFTPLPGNPHQGAIETVALEEAGVFQFSESDKEAVHEMPTSPNEYYKAEVGSRIKVKSGEHEGKEGTITSVSDSGYKCKLDNMGDQEHDLDYSQVGPVNDMDLKDRQFTEDPITGTDEIHGALKQHGWESKDKQSYTHSGVRGHKLVVRGKSWTHFGHKDIQRQGHGYVDLADHLGDFHKKVKAYNDEDVKSHLSYAEKEEDDFKVGDKVHLGFGTKGGAGFLGQITHFEGDHVHIKNERGKTYKGPKKYLSRHDIQFAEKNSDGFNKPENDLLPANPQGEVKDGQVDEPPAEPINPDVNPQESLTKTNNPDMPPKTTDKTKLSAVLAGLNQKNIVLPSDFDFQSDSAIDILLAAINSSIKADQEAEAEVEPDDKEETPTDAPMPFAEKKPEDDTQFSEEELSALPPKVRAVVEAGRKALEAEREAKAKAEAEALAFAEKERETRNKAAKDKARETIARSKLPPALRLKLLEGFGTEDKNTIQFAEGVEIPYYTASQVAEMVSASLPPALQFDEDDVKEGTKPDGQTIIGRNPDGSVRYGTVKNSEQFFESDVPVGHVSAERARELVNSQPQFFGNLPTGSPTFSPSVAQYVAAENSRSPNNVMRN